jgi:hypothetical protein
VNVRLLGIAPRELRVENRALRSALEAAKGDTVTDLAAILIIGFVLVLVVCLVFFFAVLLLLSGKSAGEFFRVPPLPKQREYPEIQQDTEAVVIRTDAFSTGCNYCMDVIPCEYTEVIK